MSLMFRVAPLATALFAAVLLISGGTPGFARENIEAVNVSTATPVPVSIQPATFSVSVTPLPAAPVTITPLPAPAPEAAPQGNVVGARPGDTVAFGSLAAAVEAQPMPEAMGEDLACLAGAIYFEAKGEPLSGQLAVAEVIKNRTKSGRYPGSICSVVTQPGQFSFVRGGRIPEVGDNRAYRTAVAVARVALGDMWDSPTPDAMFFHARRVGAASGHKTVATIGNHVFYR